MIRFLHAADLHLDSALTNLAVYEGAPVEQLRGATRRALANLVDLAISSRVDFVLLAGDIYDTDSRHAGTVLFFIGQMSRLYDAKIPVYIMAGNHDAANKMSRKLPYPDNVFTFSHDRPATMALDRFGVVLHGQSYAEQAEPNNLALTYPGAVKGMFNIGVLHTALTGREGHERYAPCMVEDLLTRNYDYWALGHVHQRESVRENAHPRVEFPGNVQGRHIREFGAKGCLIATSNGSGAVTTEFHPLDVVRWKKVTVDCEGMTDREDIHQQVKIELEAALADVGGRMLAARIELEGACPGHDALLAKSAQLRDEIRALARPLNNGAVWIEKVVVSTFRPVQRAPASPIGDDALSEIAAVAADLRARPERLQELLDLDALKALAGKMPTELVEGEMAVLLRDPVWASGLLDRARAMLVARATAKGAER